MLAAQFFERVRKPIFLLRKFFPSLFWKIRHETLFNKKKIFGYQTDLFKLKRTLKVAMAQLGATETNQRR